MKPTNKIKRHHYKSDCQIIERFYSYDDGTAVQVPVPERIKIEYYIDKGKGSIVVERKGDYCHNCSVSDDGMTLIAAIPLAKHPIGCGRLLCDKVEYIDDPLFPGGYKVKVTPMLTSIELWSQASDNDKSSAYGELLLAKIIRGKDGEGIPAGGSAGQLLSKKSDEDYDTEWVDIPQGGGGTVDIVDNLTTADPAKALSANMGRTLNEKFHYKNYLAGKNLDQKGNILDAEGWNVTTHIAVVGGTALTFECGGTNTSALCEYDANDNCIDYWGQNAHPRTITTRSNTAYVRLAVPNSPTQDYFVAQNDVVLFNKLDSYNIAEKVVDLTNDTIEVTPLSYIDFDVCPPHVRLIREWTNEKAEVLQPTDYDAETGYFTVETMPSYLAEDGAVKQLQMNYDRSLFLTPDNWKNLPKPQGGQSSWFFVKREDATHFSLWQDNAAQTALVTPSTVTVEKFYLTQGVIPYIYFPNYEAVGVHRYKLIAEHTSHIPSRYNQMAMIGQEAFAPSRGSVFYELGTGHQYVEVVDGQFEIVFEIDHVAKKYRYVSIKGSCTTRDSNSKLAQIVNRPLFGPWTEIAATNQANNIIWSIWPWAIKKDTIIKLYEIAE